MRIEATRTFARLYRKLPAEIQKRAQKSLELFQSDPVHPSLGHKKMAGQTNINEIRATQNYRITYQKMDDVLDLRKIGIHDLLRDP